jgi:ABC-type antimicrobial peptide transport system permease subunit
MAIGATETNIHWMILRQAGKLGLMGLVLGACLAVIARPLVGHLAQDVSIPFLFAVSTTGFLFLLILLAAWLPARRAARISPVISLKAE